MVGSQGRSILECQYLKLCYYLHILIPNKNNSIHFINAKAKERTPLQRAPLLSLKTIQLPGNGDSTVQDTSKLYSHLFHSFLTVNVHSCAAAGSEVNLSKRFQFPILSYKTMVSTEENYDQFYQHMSMYTFDINHVYLRGSSSSG